MTFNYNKSDWIMHEKKWMKNEIETIKEKKNRKTKIKQFKFSINCNTYNML